MRIVVGWLAARAMEPSTWAGIAVLAQSVSLAVQTRDWGPVLQSIAGGLAIVVSEGKK